MRMWAVPVQFMCSKHLLGEHLELHMFVSSIKKGRSIKGFVLKNLLDPWWIVPRHDVIVAEMVRRGFPSSKNHLTPMEFDFSIYPVSLTTPQVHMDAQQSTKDLLSRCHRCSERVPIL